MRKFLKTTTIAVGMLSLVGIIGASKPGTGVPVAKKTEKTVQEEHPRPVMIASRTLIQDDFSGVESEPIVAAFMSWMSETNGDIIIAPPTEQDTMYFDLLMNDSQGNVNIFEMDLSADGSKPEPWGPSCRHTFYVIRITSRHPVVKMLDSGKAGESKEILAFTFEGCMYKFIAVVADRMRDQNLMYTTMMHELGHMWGLADNTAGANSIMNGSWPGAMCITKKDIKDLYELHGRSDSIPADAGCNPRKVN